MTGAIEFLRKAKAICKANERCMECPLLKDCGDLVAVKEPADLVRKVMDYRLEDKEWMKENI